MIDYDDRDDGQQAWASEYAQWCAEQDDEDDRSDRISGGSLSAIATRYGIAFQTVSKIVNRKSWRHIQ